MIVGDCEESPNTSPWPCAPNPVTGARVTSKNVLRLRVAAGVGHPGGRLGSLVGEPAAWMVRVWFGPCTAEAPKAGDIDNVQLIPAELEAGPPAGNWAVVAPGEWQVAADTVTGEPTV